MFALSYSSVCIILLTSSGEIDYLVSRRIKYLRVNNQSFVESVQEESLLAFLFLFWTGGDYFGEQTCNNY